MNNSTGSLAKVSYLLRYKPDNILAPIEEAYDIATEPENLPYASRIAILFRYVNPSFLHISPLYFQWPWQLEVQQHFVASWPFAWCVAAGACGVVASSPKQAWTPSSDIPKCKCSVLFGSNYKTCNAPKLSIFTFLAWRHNRRPVAEYRDIPMGDDDEVDTKRLLRDTDLDSALPHDEAWLESKLLVRTPQSSSSYQRQASRYTFDHFELWTKSLVFQYLKIINIFYVHSIDL